MSHVDETTELREARSCELIEHACEVFPDGVAVTSLGAASALIVIMRLKAACMNDQELRRIKPAEFAEFKDYCARTLELLLALIDEFAAGNERVRRLLLIDLEDPRAGS